MGLLVDFSRVSCPCRQKRGYGTFSMRMVFSTYVAHTAISRSSFPIMSLASIPFNAFSEAAARAPRFTGLRAFAVRRRAAARRLALFGGAAVCAYLAAMGAIAVAGFSGVPRGADVMLVLGTTVYPDGTPCGRLEARLDKAVELYNATFAGKVIVSGGVGVEGVDEAVAMRRYLVARGVAEADIVTDSNGVDTYSSARFTANYLRENGLRSALVVSQFYHVPRAAYALEHFGVERVSTAHADYSGISRDIRGLIREVPACIVYAFRPYTA